MTTTLNEILFYKVIKNIFLFKKILSFLKTTPKNKIRNGMGIYTYDQIKCVEWMIEYKHYGLLLDKVMRNEELVFTCTGDTIKRFPTRSKYDTSYPMGENIKLKEITFYKYSIFNIRGDYQFYSTLFNNYKLYFQMSKKTSIKSIELNSIEYDNVPCLTVLINEYDYKPTISTYIHAVDIGSLSIADYLCEIDEIKQQLSQDLSIIETIWKTSITISNRLNEIPLLLKRLNYLVKQQPLLPVPTYINVFYLMELVSTILIHKETISTFFNLCEIVIILTTNFESYKQSIQSNSIKSIPQQQDDQQFSEFPSEIEFTELKNQIKLNTSTVIEKNIKTLLNFQLFNKFYKMFIKFTCLSICDNSKYFKKADQEKGNQENQIVKPTLSENSFLKLTQLIETNDLIQFKIQYNESDITNLPKGFNEKDAFKKVSLSIKSIEMIDLLFGLNVFSTISPINNNYNILLSSIVLNFQLSNHFKSNYSKEYIKSFELLISNDFSISLFNGKEENCSLNKFKFIFENWLDFSNYHQTFINIISLNISLKQVTISDYKKFIQLINFKTNENENENGTYVPFIPFFNNQIVSSKPSIMALEQIEYIFKMYPYFKSTRFVKTILPTIVFYKYQIGDIDYILSIFDRNDLTGDTFRFLIEQISKTNDLQFLDLLILCQFKTSTSLPNRFKEFLSKLLNYSIKTGHFIKIYQLLSSSLNFTTIDKLNTNELKNQLIETAYRNGQIEIFLYLLDQLNFGSNFPHYLLKLDVNNNNCFHNEFIKNKLAKQ